MKTIFTTLLCLCCGFGFAQTTYLKHVVRPGKAESSDRMVTLPDGNAVIASWNQGDSLLHLLKVSAASGALQWTKEYHLTGNLLDGGSILSMQYTSDNKILLGSSYLESIPNSGFNNTYLSVLAFDTSGNMLWNQVDFGPEVGGDIGEIASGRALILTSKSFAANTIFRSQVIKTNTATGAPMTAKEFSFQNRITFNGLKASGAGRAILCGLTDNFYHVPLEYDMSISKMDSSLNLLWTKVYRDSLTDVVIDIAPYANGGWLLLGSTVFGNAKDNGIVVLAVDSNGNSLWAKQYADTMHTTSGGVLRLSANSIAATSDGNYLISGIYQYPAGTNSNNEGIVLKIDPNGNILAARSYGDAGGTTRNTDRVTMAADMGGGNFLFAGHASFQILYGVDNFTVAPRAACFSNAPTLTATDVTSQIRDTAITPTAASYTSPFAPVTYTTTNVSFNTDTISCGPVGVKSIAQQALELAVYPNPSHGAVSFELKNASAIHHTQLNLFDVSGRSILSLPFTSSKLYLETATLPAGIYYYQVRTDEKAAAHGKLIVE